MATHPENQKMREEDRETETKFILEDARNQGDSYELNADTREEALEEALRRRDWTVRKVEECLVCGNKDGEHSENCPHDGDG